jgi:hypothetical protein
MKINDMLRLNNLAEVPHFYDSHTVDALKIVSIRLNLRFFPAIIAS